MGKANLLFLLMIFLTINGCNPEDENCHKSIMINNNSNQDIYVYGETHYPDTLYFGHYSGLTSNQQIYKVLANTSSNSPIQKRDCFEVVFNYGVEIPSGILMVYVFDAAILESVSWSTVVQDYLVLKRYEFTLDQLKRNNWTLSFP